jgi:hypothetical protein
MTMRLDNNVTGHGSFVATVMLAGAGSGTSQ